MTGGMSKTVSAQYACDLDGLLSCSQHDSVLMLLALKFTEVRTESGIKS